MCTDYTMHLFQVQVETEVTWMNGNEKELKPVEGSFLRHNMQKILKFCILMEKLRSDMGKQQGHTNVPTHSHSSSHLVLSTAIKSW